VLKNAKGEEQGNCGKRKIWGVLEAAGASFRAAAQQRRCALKLHVARTVGKKLKEEQRCISSDAFICG
jgi:hypothetical protein